MGTAGLAQPGLQTTMRQNITRQLKHNEKEAYLSGGAVVALGGPSWPPVWTDQSNGAFT